MIETLEGVPEDDLFQVHAEHAPGTLIFDRHYLGADRSDGIVFIEVTLRGGRTPEMKRAFYRRVVEHLGVDAGVRPDDVFIVLRENERIDWSFAHGLSQLAPGLAPTI
ncbi:tautomerase family protein [Acidiphilium sp. AL]|nr:tautomerase family protein [Acidiphilium sp. AL]